MSTRSEIIIPLADGKWAHVYCHSDGQPYWMMPSLMAQSPEAILEAGDISRITKYKIVPLRNPRPYKVTDSAESVCGWDIEHT